jgi:type IV pilus assembly protein PilB
MGALALDDSHKPDLREILKSCHLFAEISDDALNFIAPLAEEVHFKKSDCIILEKEANNYVYFIASGSVEIINYLNDEKRVQRLGLLKAGQHFAEFSVLSKSSRSGSAYAYEDAVLIRVNGASFLELLTRFPPVSVKLAKMLADTNHRIDLTNEFIPFYQLKHLGATPEVAEHFPAGLWRKFQTIPVSLKSKMLTVLMVNPYNQDFYQFIGRTLPNFEISVLAISEREFSTAVEAAQRLLKSNIKSIQPKTSAVADDFPTDPKSVFKRSGLFSELPDNLVEQLQPHISTVAVPAGTVIATVGQQIEYCYIVAKGQVQILRPIGTTKAVANLVTLSAGDTFGESEVLAESKCAYTLRASEDTVLLAVHKAIIQQLFVAPFFTVPLAKSLVRRIQSFGQVAGVKYYPAAEQTLDLQSIAHLIPLSVITEQKIIPIKVGDGEVILGAVDLDCSTAVSNIGRYLINYRVGIFGITDERFRIWRSQIEAFTNAKAKSTDPIVNAAAADPAKWLDQILLLGTTSRASDIHFEPSEDSLSVRFRVDGVLREHGEKVGSAFGKELVSRVKIVSHLDIAQQHLPQDGQLKAKIGEVGIMARVSTVPVRHGEKVVLRLIKSQSSVVPLSMMAPDRRVIDLLNSVAKCRQGLFLVTGPTGSGKTTTLYSMLNAINDVGVNVVTLEDPVELEIGGFNQIEVDRKRGLDFGVALRSVLRQDPNVIMVGEIRDEESAKIVFDAAITGHLVLSTLHTSSSLDVGPRLRELGVSPATMATGLLGVLSQRLLRENCKKCLTYRPASESERQLFRTVLRMEHPPTELPQPRGCPACDNTGYHSRIPVFEVWRNSLAMRKALLDSEGVEEMMKIARDDGYETLYEFGLKMVLTGLTSLSEVRRVLSSL